MKICDFCGDLEFDDRLAQCYQCHYDVCRKDSIVIQDVLFCIRCEERYFSETPEIQELH